MAKKKAKVKSTAPTTSVVSKKEKVINVIKIVKLLEDFIEQNNIYNKIKLQTTDSTDLLHKIIDEVGYKDPFE